MLEWFAEADMPMRSEVAVVPEPPAVAVREVVRGSVLQRLLETARSAAGAGEEGQDALYEAAARLLGAAHPGGRAGGASGR